MAGILSSGLAEWFRDHNGVVSSARLVGLGVSDSTRQALLSNGVMTVVYEGVYRLRAWPDTFESRCAAACAADPSVVVACGTAAQLWGFRRSHTPQVHALTPRPTRVIASDVTLHRCPVVPRVHVVVRRDGIRVTSPHRTIFDLAKHVSDVDLESVIEQAIDTGRITIAALHAVGRDLCRTGRPGSTRFRRVVSARPVWRRPADSHPELVLRAALEAVGVNLQPQLTVTLPDGSEVHPDLGDRDAGFFVEVDHPTWHGRRAASAVDRRRDRQLRLMGCRIERVSTDEMEVSLAAVVTELRAAYIQHLARRVV